MDRRWCGWSHWCWDNIKCILLAFNPVLFQVEVRISIQFQLMVQKIRIREVSVCTS